MAIGISLTDDELQSLAVVCGRDLDDLASTLGARPWAIHDILAEPETIDAVLHPESLIDATSPFVLFAVLTRLAADELLGSTHVNDWIGPGTRLPVFDVEPLQEFVIAPGRVIFVARLLASMVAPAPVGVPVAVTDPWELLDWTDAVDDTATRVALLRRLGDVALFFAGVHADASAGEELTPDRAAKVARSLAVTVEEILALTDADSPSPGIDALEQLGARWYHEARRAQPEVPPVVTDVAERIHSARRFLTHLADRHLGAIAPAVELAG